MSSTIGLHCKGIFLLYTLYMTLFLKESGSVSLNPFFPWAYSTLIGQMDQSDMIGLPLTGHGGFLATC